MLPALRDGIYSLTYRAALAASDGAASGLAIVRTGDIIGSDAAGGLFKGRITTDPATSETYFRGHMTLPPHSELITGFRNGGDDLIVELSATCILFDNGARFVAEVAGATINVEALYIGPLPQPLHASREMHASRET